MVHGDAMRGVGVGHAIDEGILFASPKAVAVIGRLDGGSQESRSVSFTALLAGGASVGYGHAIFHNDIFRGVQHEAGNRRVSAHSAVARGAAVFNDRSVDGAADTKTAGRKVFHGIGGGFRVEVIVAVRFAVDEFQMRGSGDVETASAVAGTRIITVSATIDELAVLPPSKKTARFTT